MSRLQRGYLNRVGWPCGVQVDKSPSCERKARLCLCALLAPFPLMVTTTARADEIWIGVYEHDVTIAQTRFETGQDVKAGWIGDPIEGLRIIGSPSPHLLVSKSLSGQTDYAAVGVNWTFGSRFYARPGIGLAVNNGPRPAYRDGWRVDLGSPITFEPEIALGWRINERHKIEASWVHLSHATLFSRQNRGMDSIGLRLLVRLP